MIAYQGTVRTVESHKNAVLIALPSGVTRKQFADDIGFGGRDVPGGLDESAVVEPVDPFKGCIFYGFETVPRAATVDEFGFEQTIDRLGQSFVVTVANAADRGIDACLG